MKTKFSPLQLNKRSIAKMDDNQLSSVKGGNNTNDENDGCQNTGVTCENTGVTVVTGQ